METSPRQPTPTGPALWPDEDAGPFRLYLIWAVIDGRQEVVGIELSSIRADDGWKNPTGWEPTPIRLTSDHLRMLTDGRAKSFTSIVEDTKGGLVSLVEWWATIEPARTKELAQRVKALEAGQRKTRGAPAKWGPDHYALVSLIYEEALGRSFKPTKAVAQHWGVSPSTAANWVAKARKLGFLGQTQRGKSGGIRPSEGEDDES